MAGKFRLATVERLRDVRAQECARALHEASAAVQDAEQHCRALTAQLEYTPERWLLTGQNMVLAAAFRDRLRADLKVAEAEVARRVEARNEARAQWLTARAELRAVEMLHDRHRAAMRAEQARREQRELDELASRAAVGLAGAGGGDR